LEEYGSLARAARDLGADRLVVCSSAFLYADDGGRPLLASSPVVPGAETVGAHAAEEAARLFTSLGGCSVVLRLGWVFGDCDPMTAKVVSAAQKGWQLIEGRPSSWVAAIASTDAARAIHAALVMPPGTYNVSNGQPVTQGAINAVLEQATGKVLHPLYDASWGESGTLFGASRLLADHRFGELTGWLPTGTDLCHHLLLRARYRGLPKHRRR
jgi:nucleoside-diphosphate-sugar epimerase